MVIQGAQYTETPGKQRGGELCSSLQHGLDVFEGQRGFFYFTERCRVSYDQWAHALLWTCKLTNGQSVIVIPV